MRDATRLPMDPHPYRSTTPSASAQTPALRRPITGTSACIAVAEDDADMRDIVAGALRRDGYGVIELPTGVALLFQLAHQYRRYEPHPRIDLIVSDLRMPTMTGLEILRGLRQGRCPTPFILMTAFGDPETRREAQSLGAVMLDKPLSLADLRREVRRLLG
jgi:CheY-like chemotaxis protein